MAIRIPPAEAWRSGPLRVRVAVVFALLVTACVPEVAAQRPAPRANPEDLGIVLPEGTPIPGDDRRVVLQDGDEPVVGRVHVEIGDRLIVLTPDLRLASVPTREVTFTERPFVPASGTEMADDLQQQFQGFKVRSTKRYLYVYDTSDGFFKATSRILETMYPPLLAYSKRHKLEVHEPLTPLVVVMFRTKKQYQTYRPMPEGVLAYYNAVSNRIVLYEQSELGEALPELAFKQAISTIAHEGVHQILHNIGVQQRLADWPMWISEGLADYFAPTDLGKRLRWKGIGHCNDLRMLALIRHLDQESTSLNLRQLVRAQQLDALGYARSWGLVHFLSKRYRRDFVSLIQAVSALEPLAPPPQPGSLFEASFGKDYGRLEQEMLQHLRGVDYVDPVANQTHYVIVTQEARVRRVLVTASLTRVREIQAQRRAEVRSFPDRATAQRFADQLLHRR